MVDRYLLPVAKSKGLRMNLRLRNKPMWSLPFFVGLLCFTFQLNRFLTLRSVIDINNKFSVLVNLVDISSIGPIVMPLVKLDTSRHLLKYSDVVVKYKISIISIICDKTIIFHKLIIHIILYCNYHFLSKLLLYRSNLIY